MPDAPAPLPLARGTVLALAGRRVDASGSPPRFPAANIRKVERRMRKLLRGAAAETLVCAAASGADLLALQAARELGVRRRVVLPFGRAVFRQTSVTDRGGDWGERFDLELDRLPAGDLMTLGFAKDDPQAYAAANAAILDQAAQIAESRGLRPMAAVVWEGQPRSEDDLTVAFLREAQARGFQPVTISTL